MSVRAIDKKTVHQICSGQVVLSLAVAVKELVENSLDSGATSIEVRLKEYGSELVEVTDNGSGVDEVDFQGLTLKHHTSKIQDFSDLEMGVATFGFRGEALSSLCALSDMTITTCHESKSVGTKLLYDNNGVIKSQSSCAREVGTTVSIARLFYTLPVRHKEFLRNLKKEFNKMVQMLQGYCLVSTGVRISCCNQAGKNCKKQQVLATSGNPNLRANILDVFGPKQLEQLVEFPECVEDDFTAREECSHLTSSDINSFKFTGYISRCTQNYGRSAADRQFYFFNNRPCDHAKLARTVNEVYHMFNRHQYPCVILNISTARESIDVNITPDKRQVMLHHEKVLLLLIRVSLCTLYEQMQGQFDTHSLSTGTTPISSEATSISTPSSSSSPGGPRLSGFTNFKRNVEHLGNARKVEPATKQAKLVDFGVLHPGRRSLTEESSIDNEILCTDEFPLPSKEDERHVGPSSDVRWGVSPGDTTEEMNDKGDTLNDYHIAEEEHLGSSDHEEEEILRSDCDNPISPSRAHLSPGSLKSGPLMNFSYRPVNVMTSPVKSKLLDVKSNERESKLNSKHVREVSSGKKKSKKALSMNLDSAASSSPSHVPEMEVRLDLDVITTRLRSLWSEQEAGSVNEGKSTTGEVPSSSSEGVVERQRSRFRAKIDPSSNKTAEEELRKEIKKSDFLQMQVIGQFNLGFIIARLGSDLFIVDQHATDEKYNFERLQEETVIQHQKLLIPKDLELSAVSESIIMDNLKIFEMNGFKFQIDTEAPPMKRIKLAAKPVSKNWSMEKKDIEEMVFMLSDDGCTPGEVVRPTAVRSMFASRACRSSIMIGTALNKVEMRKLLNHMSEMEQPWNCPHGRPTMRHLIDMDRLKTTDIAPEHINID